MIAAILALAICVCVLLQLRHERSTTLHRIPSIGHQGFFASYISALRFLREGDLVIREGYKRYKNGTFKIPLMDRWVVIVTGDRLVENLRTAPEEELSMWEAMEDLLQIRYTLGPRVRDNMSPIRHGLNRNLDNLLPDILDEIACVVQDLIGRKVNGQDWVGIPGLDTCTQIATRVASRAFIGLPVCRNKEYLKLNVEFANTVMTGAGLINLFPQSLKPFAGMLYSRVTDQQNVMMRLIGPEIEERKRKMQGLSANYPGKPNDMLTWLMEYPTEGSDDSTKALALRMLQLNFMSIQSTSMFFTHAIYYLASQPKYATVLREEIEIHLGPFEDSHRWTGEDIERCEKLDSFLKETFRLSGIGSLGLPRKALVPYTLADGTLIPPGTILSAAPLATHLDDERYENAERFDGLRFANLRKQSRECDDNGNEDAKYRLTSAGPSYLTFGGGKHLCPGRFFGSLQLKCMMIYLLTFYDLKTSPEGVRPQDEWFGSVCMPARREKVYFRCRQ